MRGLSRNLTFWILTLVFLGLVGGIGWLVIPAQLRSVSASRAELIQLAAQVSENEQFLATLGSIEKEPETLDELYQKATLSLPMSPQPEILILQLDGLLASLSLSTATIEVPLSAPVSEEGTGQTAITKFTISGSMSFDQVKQLIVQLRTLSRWNQLTAIDITTEGEKTTATITGQASSRVSSPKTFTGKQTFLADAEALFNRFTPYTTVPNIETEGNFGKSNPFD